MASPRQSCYIVSTTIITTTTNATATTTTTTTPPRHTPRCPPRHRVTHANTRSRERGRGERVRGGSSR
ncbi:hypothetical protein E2C01_101988 [Portunus trituberculatus]|uniref:Uncharacterized protein n=1 Tax=Portunus trituberculatus TaxID=210409 RepID=A0A5B7KH71_PORTR|nr:hypothetical protein [Portunus trituberculatus]